MAGIQTFTIEHTLSFLRIEWLYTLARLLKNAHTADFVAAFQAVGPILDAAIKAQNTLEDASVVADAGYDAADYALDPIVLQIIHALLVVTKNNREDPQYISYTGNQTGAQITHPVLGPELTTVAAWVEPLKNETDTSLQAFSAPLDAAVTAGRTAEREVKATAKALTDFRLVGERKKAVDALNAARGILLGLLIKFQHQNTQLRLPTNWATSFFRHAVKGEKYGTTIAQAEEHLARLAEETKAAEAHLEELKQKAADHEEAKAKRAKARLDLAAARKAEKELKKQERALEDEATKKLKKRK